MTAAERLKALSGMAGVSAGAMLIAIGVGLTAGGRLVDYSGLASGSAAQHILVSHDTQFASGDLSIIGASSFVPGAQSVATATFSHGGTSTLVFGLAATADLSYLISSSAHVSWKTVDGSMYPANGWQVAKVLSVGNQVFLCAEQRGEIVI